MDSISSISGDQQFAQGLSQQNVSPSLGSCQSQSQQGEFLKDFPQKVGESPNGDLKLWSEEVYAQYSKKVKSIVSDREGHLSALRESLQKLQECANRARSLQRELIDSRWGQGGVRTATPVEVTELTEELSECESIKDQDGNLLRTEDFGIVNRWEIAQECCEVVWL